MYVPQGLEPGLIRKFPDDFRVFERHEGFLCTTSLESDMPDRVEFGSRRETGFVGVTLVKRLIKTPDAVAALAEMFGLRPEQVSIAGQKDARAETAQRIVFDNVDLDVVARACRPEPLERRGPSSFIKDATVEPGALRLSGFLANRFRIWVTLEGWRKEKVERYVAQRLAPLGSANVIQYPNAYGPQRFGRRKIGHDVGHAFIVEGAEAAFKMFVTQTSRHERREITEVREELGRCWARAEETARQTGCSVAQVREEFVRMRDLLERVARDFQLEIEERLVKEVLSLRSFDEAASSLLKDVGLWLGAYQAYWFNQVLAAVVSGALKLSGDAIPMYKDDPVVKNWYWKVGFGEAIPAQINRRTAKLFPRGVAWRPTFTTVSGLKHVANNGAWLCEFELPPGAFATAFLDQLFEVIEWPHRTTR
jgi:TruD family tRNA pseudouridine synthase